ncbi:glycoside hydrolase family 32 protein [Vagococcus zengguangii]|uniref:Sucrose-6-phosphate hydrolase n=1 Tax=Vagococcus zengguangii TaxID=2571750 RepID=A0A4D7CUC6_9ENTE|nr:sucrose-6-phosphate hydrolase [Vagococcus zengguangii]QCI85910.1 sucrose-6-phosphate hydrolase [Vagococcus zengguangii]TLG78400.1 sucrose-6-phosphate hydrolase [Vagococcus zengguangii]
MLDGVVKSSKYASSYHITPLEGLLNDPNGLICFKGIYHVFYQWNATGTTHENKSWGHLISKDLVNWERLAPALVPSEYYDKNGVYSGTAVEKDNLLYLFYTGNVINEDGSKVSYQCYATSEDGIVFEKHGPMFEHPPGYTRHVRDPKVWFEEEEQLWYLILGAQTEDEMGTAIYYTSRDLKEWTFGGEMFSPEELAKLSQRGFMWECPDIVTLNNQRVFIYSPQGIEAQSNRYLNIYQSAYLTIKKNQQTFMIEHPEIVELDHGFEFYAPQTFVDKNGNQLMFAWMGVMPPEVEQTQPTIAEGWVHQLTIPRVLTFENGKLYQRPAQQLSTLRQSKQVFSIENKWEIKPKSMALEVDAIFEEASGDFEWKIKESTQITYQQKNKRLVISRLNWFTKLPEQRIIELEDDLKVLRLFIDGSSLEVFVNEGEAVASLRYFDNSNNRLSYHGTNQGQVTIYELKGEK